MDVAALITGPVLVVYGLALALFYRRLSRREPKRALQSRYLRASMYSAFGLAVVGVGFKLSPARIGVVLLVVVGLAVASVVAATRRANVDRG